MTQQGKGPVTVTTTAELQAALAAGHKPEEISMDHKAAVAEAVKADRGRIKAILEHAETKGREAFAVYLALDSDTTVEAAGALLAKMPKTPDSGGLRAAMDRIGTPGVGSEEITTTGADKAPVVNANKIFEARRLAAAK